MSASIHKKPHKHAELIHAWADGAFIEYREGGCDWEFIKRPAWKEGTEYRIKPELDIWMAAKQALKILNGLSQNYESLYSCEQSPEEIDQAINDLVAVGVQS